MPTLADQYVRLRLKGHGSRESARLVGFASGRPSGHAHRLWNAVKLARRQPAGEAWARRAVAEYSAKLEDAKVKLRAYELAAEYRDDG